MAKSELVERITVNGHTFKLIKNSPTDIFYECRGEVMYDDYHDQTPEPSLWKGAKLLVIILERDGYRASEEHSEKGWVEVCVFDD